MTCEYKDGTQHGIRCNWVKALLNQRNRDFQGFELTYLYRIWCDSDDGGQMECIIYNDLEANKGKKNAMTK